MIGERPTGPIEKPKSKKKRKLQNGWKDRPNRRCKYCGRTYADRHEIFGGNNRQISIKEGFQIDVCSATHEELHRNTSERAQKENKRLRVLEQRRWEEELIDSGADPIIVRNCWMNMMGENYDTDPDIDLSEPEWICKDPWA